MTNKDAISRAGLLRELNAVKIDGTREFDAGYKAALAMARLVVCQAPSVRPQVGHGSPCDLCRYNPPSSCDGKPCTMCPAEDRTGGGDDDELEPVF